MVVVWGGCLSLSIVDVLSSLQTKQVQPLSNECIPHVSSYQARTYSLIAYHPRVQSYWSYWRKVLATKALLPCLLSFLLPPSLACLYSILSSAGI